MRDRRRLIFLNLIHRPSLFSVIPRHPYALIRARGLTCTRHAPPGYRHEYEQPGNAHLLLPDQPYELDGLADPCVSVSAIHSA